MGEWACGYNVYPPPPPPPHTHTHTYTTSGNDGLIKLWTIKTSECVTTLDQHTEKVCTYIYVCSMYGTCTTYFHPLCQVWSLTASSNGDLLISGGADSLVCQWKVCVCVCPLVLVPSGRSVCVSSSSSSQSHSW